MLSAEQRAALLPDDGVRNLPSDPATLQRRVSGASGLKSSQAYPKDFGLEIYRLWQANEEENMLNYKEEEIDIDEEVPWAMWAERHGACDCWKDLKLDEIAEFLGVPTDYPLA